jgi:hypothetical protein
MGYKFSLIQLLTKSLLLNQNRKKRKTTIEQANRLRLKALVKYRRGSLLSALTGLTSLSSETLLKIY